MMMRATECLIDDELIIGGALHFEWVDGVANNNLVATMKGHTAEIVLTAFRKRGPPPKKKNHTPRERERRKKRKEMKRGVGFSGFSFGGQKKQKVDETKKRPPPHLLLQDDQEPAQPLPPQADAADDEDPLDAFMVGIHETVKKETSDSSGTKKVLVMLYSALC